MILFMNKFKKGAHTMKNSKSTILKRHDLIIKLLKINNKMSTRELSEATGMSISTIQRDLNILEEKNEIINGFGYSILNEDNHKFDLSGPELIKNKIAKKASEFIYEYNTIFINSSSTALLTLNYLKARHVTIMTNNVKISEKIFDNTNTYILTGGEVRIPKETLIGDIAVNTILSMNADVCIIGCSGIDFQNGVTTENFYEAKINRLMIDQTHRYKILVADYRKVGVTSKFKISKLEEFDCLITDEYTPKKMIELIKSKGIKVELI